MTSLFLTRSCRTQEQVLRDRNARYLNLFAERRGDSFCEQMGLKTLDEAIEDIRDCAYEYQESVAKLPDGSWHGVDLTDLVREVELDAAAERKFQEDTRRDYLARVL